jgi:hypothetical protein
LVNVKLLLLRQVEVFPMVKAVDGPGFTLTVTLLVLDPVGEVSVNWNVAGWGDVVELTSTTATSPCPDPALAVTEPEGTNVHEKLVFGAELVGQ